MRVTLSLVVLSGLAAGCSSPRLPPRADPVVVLTTDFGLRDDAVGLMRGVIHAIAPRARIADLTHEAPRFDVRAGARIIAEAPGLYPPGSVFVVVVDPGVGTSRRALAARLRNGTILVAPDNGVLTAAIDRHGPAEVREVTDRSLMRADLDPTFHGRDLFAPVGAHLAAGVAFERVGQVVGDWVRLDLPRARRSGAALEGEVTSLDEPFGNVWTNIPGAWLQDLGGAGARVRVRFQGAGREVGPIEMAIGRTFGDVREGQPVAYVNSRGDVAFALNMRDFARTHRVEPGMRVSLAR